MSIPGSSNGRTSAFGVENLGSTPSPGTTRCPWAGKPCDCADFPWTRNGRVPDRCEALMPLDVVAADKTRVSPQRLAEFEAYMDAIAKGKWSRHVDED